MWGGQLWRARAYNGGMGAEPQRGPGAEPLVRGQSSPKLKGFVIGTPRREAGESCHFRIQLVSISYHLSHRIWAILVTRLNMCPRDYFTAINGDEWPKGKRAWELDAQSTVPSSLPCHGVDWNWGGDTPRKKRSSFQSSETRSSSDVYDTTLCFKKSTDNSRLNLQTNSIK